jgi:hypothetical protein
MAFSKAAQLASLARSLKEMEIGEQEEPEFHSMGFAIKKPSLLKILGENPISEELRDKIKLTRRRADIER